MVFLATSPGKFGAKTVLAFAETSTAFLGGTVTGRLSIGSFYDVFDLEKRVFKNPALKSTLLETVQTLV